MATMKRRPGLRLQLRYPTGIRLHPISEEVEAENRREADDRPMAELPGLAVKCRLQIGRGIERFGIRRSVGKPARSGQLLQRAFPCMPINRVIGI